MYAIEFHAGKDEKELELFQTLDEAMSIKARIAGVCFIYKAHTEKKGYNTVIVCDYLMRRPDGTPL